MKNSLKRTMIETTVRNTIKNIKEDPDRSMRNLIDLALNFSDGRFQQHFLESAQRMLENESSCYYKLVPDLVAHIDTNRLVTFGMNVGYNSCTLGARKIRKIESKEQFNIPWSVYLKINGTRYPKNASAYHSLIEQGTELGIYTWIIHVPDNPANVLELIEAFPDCAFVLLCSPDIITPAMLEEAATLYNVMFAIEYCDLAASACALLRSGKFLYSVYCKTDEKKEINYDEILSDTENLNAPFTFFYSTTHTSTEYSAEQRKIHQIRMEQTYHTVPFDLIQDVHLIDGIISEQACSVAFALNGSCYSLATQTLYENHTIFTHSLREILCKSSPKSIV